MAAEMHIVWNLFRKRLAAASPRAKGRVVSFGAASIAVAAAYANAAAPAACGLAALATFVVTELLFYQPLVVAWPQVRHGGIDIGDIITVVSWSEGGASRVLLGGAIREVVLQIGSDPVPGDFIVRSIERGRFVVAGQAIGREPAHAWRRQA